MPPTKGSSEFLRIPGKQTLKENPNKKNKLLWHTLTEEQIAEKKQLFVQKTMELKALYDEIKSAGPIELSDDELENVTGGGFFQDVGNFFKKYGEGFVGIWVNCYNDMADIITGKGNS
ncbi:MAG: bacteriocin [Bacteroidaceae bacterium]|nr:bacteriocin [Bacteroidaceae bacterium]